MSQPYEESQLYRIRHSAAHVMAQAMLERFPEAHIAIGPPIEDGFYYDFGLPRPVQEEDLAWVEARMKEIVKGDHPFSVREVEVSEALDLFRDQPYKVELINDLVHGRTDENGEEIAAPASKLTVYTQDSFTDLCRGPHVASTKDINPGAISITFKPPAGAYWRGDEKRPMLTRIYGTAWESPEQLAEYLHRLEEAKRRDHRYLGEKLDLFILDPLVGKGLPLWLPKGAILRDTLERWLRQLLLDSGYEPVVTPHIGSIELYKTSGHYPYYKDTQYAPIDVDGELFLLKPMNCPHHIMIYKSELRSFRDLPVRYAEYGTVYRYEKSGQLHGLTRVRGFTQDDAHLFVTPEQLEAEYISTVKLAQYVMGTLGMTDFRARVGIRDPKSDKFIGDDALWETSTNAIINACEVLGLEYTIEEGEAAFYGPKLDLVFHDVLKREWQLGTVQVDPNLPERFELEYVDSDGQRKRPVMIHRALFGSVERFIGIMIEHFGGAFPTWLAPVQAVLIPIADRHVEYLQGVASKMRARGLRVEVDTSNNRMGAKIAMAREQQVPYMLIAGDRDVAAEAVSMRLRTDEDRGQMPVEDAIAHIAKVVESHALEL
ncbi:MAG: threonine--tRNA ligase [Chloroflexi bacterium]|nr:threonine--tRNA ligase [Chloroflexota bacterium]